MKGMKNLTNKRFGRLMAIRPMEKRMNKNVVWECKCDCGNICETPSRYLLNDIKKSCGCLYKETRKSCGGWNKLEKGEAGLTALICSYKRGAKLRNLCFNLTKEQVRYLTSNDCYYCGVHPSLSRRNYIYNGIDRIDNNKGYVLENCVSCCRKCNSAKQDLSVEIFYNWIKSIYFNRIYEALKEHGTENIDRPTDDGTNQEDESGDTT